MQFALLIAMLLTLSAAEAAPAEAAGSPWLRAAAVAAIGAAVALTAYGGSALLRRQLMRRPELATHWGRRFRRLQTAHRVLLLGGAAAAVYGLHWPQVVRSDWQLAGVPVLDELLLLLPVVAPMVCSWAGFYTFEHAAACLVAAHHSQPPPSLRCRQHVAMRCRHHLGLLVAPVVLMLATQDLLMLALPADWVATAGWMLPLALAGGMLLLLPAWLRRMWQTTALPPGALRERLLQTAANVRLRFQDVLVWNTNQQVANAAVAGFSGRLRYVYLTDRLLSMLDADETEAVLLHEAAHVRRRHLWIRLACLALPVAVWQALRQQAPGLVEGALVQLEASGIPSAWQAGLLLPVLIGGYAAVALGGLSRLLEYDADLWAAQRCRLESAGRSPMLRSLDKLADLDPAAERGSWLHPSLSRRIDFLAVFCEAPQTAIRFQRRVTLLGLLSAAAVAVCMGLALI